MIHASRVMGETYAGSVASVKRCTSLSAAVRRPGGRRGIAGIALLASLVPLAGCASDTPGRASGAAPTSAASADPADPADAADLAGASDLPAVDVRNLATGETLNLQSLLPSTKPLVVWFWAPY